MSTENLARLSCIRGAPSRETRTTDSKNLQLKGATKRNQEEIEKRVLDRLRSQLQSEDSGQLIAVVPLYHTVDERKGKCLDKNAAAGTVQVGPTLNLTIADLLKPEVQEDRGTSSRSTAEIDTKLPRSGKYSGNISTFRSRATGGSGKERTSPPSKSRKVTFAVPPAEQITLSTDHAVKTKSRYPTKRVSQRRLVAMLKKLNCTARPVKIHEGGGRFPQAQKTSHLALENPVYVAAADDEATQPPTVEKAKKDASRSGSPRPVTSQPEFVPNWASFDTGSTCSTVDENENEYGTDDDDDYSDIFTDDEESIRQQLYGLLKEAREDPWRVFSVVDKQDVEETAREAYSNPWIVIRER